MLKKSKKSRWQRVIGLKNWIHILIKKRESTLLSSKHWFQISSFMRNRLMCPGSVSLMRHNDSRSKSLQAKYDNPNGSWKKSQSHSLSKIKNLSSSNVPSSLNATNQTFSSWERAAWCVKKTFKIQRYRTRDCRLSTWTQFIRHRNSWIKSLPIERVFFTEEGAGMMLLLLMSKARKLRSWSLKVIIKILTISS